MTSETRETGGDAGQVTGPPAPAAPAPAGPAAARQPEEQPGGRADAGAGPATAATRANLVRMYLGTDAYAPVVVGFLAAVALVILVAQNTSDVAVHWLTWSITVPSGAVMLAAVLAGSLLTILGGLSWRRRQRWILSELEDLRRLRERAGQAPPGGAAGAAGPAQPPHPPGAHPS